MKDFLALPVTYVGFINSDGQHEFRIDGTNHIRPPSPYSGNVLVQFVCPTKGRPTLYADGGGYKYQLIKEVNGAPGYWVGSFNLNVRRGQSVRSYAYYPGSQILAEDAGSPISVTFTPLGELKN